MRHKHLLTYVVGFTGLVFIVANVRAMWICAPQRGSWAPWTDGTICYGKNPGPNND